MNWLRSAFFNLCFYGYTTLMAIFCMPLLLGPRSWAMWVGRNWAGGSMWLAKHICGITWELRGEEHIPQGAVIFACKHQSAWETLLFWVYCNDPAYVLKRELAQIPAFGLYIKRQKHIAVDRKAGVDAMKRMMADTKAALALNRTIIIFPEGTRIRPGEKSVYHPGVAALYNQTEASVVPVALNSGIYWGRRAFFKKPGKIIVQFLPPMEAGLKSRVFLMQLEERIETTSAALA